MTEMIHAHLVWLAGFIPLCGLFLLLFYAIGAPLRRQERARFFLDLLDTGLREGRTAEETIVSLARTRDHTIGIRMHLLAAHLESGWRLVPALERVKRLVPPQVTAMLAVGDQLGDFRKVIPACRSLLRDGASSVQGAYNYLIVLAFVLVPVMPALFWMLSTSVQPRLVQVFASVLGAQPDSEWFELMRFGTTLAKLQIGVAAVLYVAAILYVGGPWLSKWLEAGLPFSVIDRIVWLIPWRRKRMQRDFSAMLALLLDEGVPEPIAVRLAAHATANATFKRRADQVVRRLESGVPLPQAVVALEKNGQFDWRLRNALGSGQSFVVALRGWLEWLDAKAFQEEQAVAQGVTTGLVILNGLMVGAFTLFVFRSLTLIMNAGILW